MRRYAHYTPVGPSVKTGLGQAEAKPKDSGGLEKVMGVIAMAMGAPPIGAVGGSTPMGAAPAGSGVTSGITGGGMDDILSGSGDAPMGGAPMQSPSLMNSGGSMMNGAPMHSPVPTPSLMGGSNKMMGAPMQSPMSSPMSQPPSAIGPPGQSPGLTANPTQALGGGGSMGGGNSLMSQPPQALGNPSIGNSFPSGGGMPPMPPTSMPPQGMGERFMRGIGKGMDGGSLAQMGLSSGIGGIADLAWGPEDYSAGAAQDPYDSQLKRGFQTLTNGWF